MLGRFGTGFHFQILILRKLENLPPSEMTTQFNPWNEWMFTTHKNQDLLSRWYTLANSAGAKTETTTLSNTFWSCVEPSTKKKSPTVGTNKPRNTSIFWGGETHSEEKTPIANSTQEIHFQVFVKQHELGVPYHSSRSHVRFVWKSRPFFKPPVYHSMVGLSQRIMK